MERGDNLQVVGGTLRQSIISCLKVLDRVIKRQEVVITSMLVADKGETETRVKTIKETVADLLGIRNLKTVNQTYTLPQLGLDSIMVVDVKEKLERVFNVNLTLKEIRKLTFQE